TAAKKERAEARVRPRLKIISRELPGRKILSRMSGAALPAAFNQSPSSEYMREGDDVGLSIAAVDAERVQLHHFACVVLIDAVELAVSAGRVGRGVLPVVEIEEHGGMFGGRAEQIAKAAHRMWTNGFFLEGAGPDAAEALAGEDVEVVEPEGGHDFLELADDINGAHDASLDRLHDHLAGRMPDRLACVGVVLGGLPQGLLELQEEFDRCHPERAQPVDPAREIVGLGNRFGVELALGIALETDLADGGEVARARSEGEPVKDVQ